jgi:hypothetical protein
VPVWSFCSEIVGEGVYRGAGGCESKDPIVPLSYDVLMGRSQTKVTKHIERHE